MSNSLQPSCSMETHSSTLAWKIPWMEEPGRLQSMGSQRVGHDWETSLFTLQHTRFPCPSLSLGVFSNSCPLSWWCHPTISSSVAHFSSCPQSFPSSGFFPMSLLFASGSQSVEALASALVLPVLISGVIPGLISFRIDWFDLLDV